MINHSKLFRIIEQNKYISLISVFYIILTVYDTITNIYENVDIMIDVLYIKYCVCG